MWKLSRPAPRRTRRVRPIVDDLEVRQTPTGTMLTSPLALVMLNPQPLPPGSSPTAVSLPAQSLLLLLTESAAVGLPLGAVSTAVVQASRC